MLNPFALPVHPIVVHFSVAMLASAWACSIVRYATGDIRWDVRSRLFELVGVWSLPLTIATAFIDTRGIGFLIHPRADRPLIWHATAGGVVAIAFAAHYLWRRKHTAEDLVGRAAITDVALMTFAMIALVGAGLLAGEVAFG